MEIDCIQQRIDEIRQEIGCLRRIEVAQQRIDELEQKLQRLIHLKHRIQDLEVERLRNRNREYKRQERRDMNFSFPW